ncbi:MAG: hypothetical protein NTW86_13595, partial [Candidatus Sumerlaeota bacterium]|nr:hypothetical protein [Candidatus Sumerlaeota bacterium]
DDAGGCQPCMLYAYEDWELWLAIAEKGWALVAWPEPLARYRVRLGSMLQSMAPASYDYLRRTMAARHPDLFLRYRVEGWLIAEQRCRAEMAALAARLDRVRRLALHPVEAIQFAVEKIGWRLGKRLQRD